MQILQPNYQRSDERGTLDEIQFESKQVNVLHIRKGKEFGGHYHKDKTEVFYVVSGIVVFTVMNQTTLLSELLAAKEIIRIDPYDQHTLYAFEDSVIVELLSSPYDEKDTFKYGEKNG
jgi:quercetin dioxygenase-like cupin family protein